MMNDRERAQVVLYRRLLQIEHGDTQGIDDALRSLLLAIDAELVLLSDSEARFERHVSRDRLEPADVRARVSQRLIEEAVRTSRPAVDEACTKVCVPVVGAVFAATVYARTRGVFVDADLALIQVFARSVVAITVELVEEAPVGLHAQVREFQVRRVRHALDRHGGNVAGAARALKIQRSLVYRLLRRNDD